MGQYIHNHVDSLIPNECEKIEAELNDVEGFLEVEKTKEEIEKRLGDIVEADQHLKKIGQNLKN